MWRINGNELEIGLLSIESPLAAFMGLMLYLHKMDDMDTAAWKQIDRQEGARAQIWHTKQGVFRKNSHQMCGMTQWKVHLMENESFHKALWSLW